jgi:hypothetical protein
MSTNKGTEMGNVEAIGLSCRICEEPLDPKTAVLTATGYACRDCVRGRKRRFVTAKWFDYITAFGLSFLLSAIASYLVSLFSNMIGFYLFFILFFVSPFIGGLIAEAVRFVTRRRRAKLLFQMAAAGTVIGGVLPHLGLLLFLFLGFEGAFGVLYQLVSPVIYIVLATGAVYYRLSGIQLFKR